MCQFNKRTTLVGDVVNGGMCACVGAGGVRTISTLSAQFCCEYHSVMKKNEIHYNIIPSRFILRVNLEGIMLKSEKDKSSVFSLTCEI